MGMSWAARHTCHATRSRAKAHGDDPLVSSKLYSPGVRDDALAMKDAPTIADIAVDSHHLETRRGAIERASLVGGVAWVTFFLFDVLVQQLLYPETSLLWCAAWRLIGLGFAAMGWFGTRRPMAKMGAYRALALVVTCGVSMTLGMLALGFGGLGSVYTFAMTFILSAVTLFIIERWQVMALIVLGPLLAYFAVLILGALLDPLGTRPFDAPGALHQLAVNAVIVVGLAAFSLIGTHRQWIARVRLADAKRLGRYRLERLLGRGGMNEVWLASDSALPRRVALKILRGTTRDDIRLQRFEREAEATSRLNSPFTVRIFDYGRNPVEGTAWIAMEHLQGCDLDGVLKIAGPLPVARVLHFARQAAASLAEAHELGLVHRDIKPENIFICNKGAQPDSLKVIDFGIATHATHTDMRLTRAGLVVGTPAFMAPEHLMGQRADARCDVYGLGATIYTMLTGGRVPMDTDNLIELVEPQARARIKPPSDLRGEPVPVALEALVMRCIAGEARFRPADGAELLMALEAIHGQDWTEQDAAEAWWSHSVETTRRQRSEAALGASGGVETFS